MLGLKKPVLCGIVPLLQGPRKYNLRSAQTSNLFKHALNENPALFGFKSSCLRTVKIIIGAVETVFLNPFPAFHTVCNGNRLANIQNASIYSACV